MNNFLFNYAGNKYAETKKYLDKECKQIAKSKHITVICEPYCGIFGFSRAFYELTNKDGNGHITYKLNDIDGDLIEFYKQLKQDYKNKMKQVIRSLSATQSMNTSQIRKYIKTSKHLKVFSKLSNFLSYERLRSKVFNFIKKKEMYMQFFDQCTFYNMDAFEFMEKHCSTKNAIAFIDPPYNFSFNASYKTFTSGHKTFEHDATHIFVYLLQPKLKLQYIGIIDGSSIMKYVFRDHIVKTYVKTYAMSQTKKDHLVISNIF